MVKGRTNKFLLTCLSLAIVLLGLRPAILQAQSIKSANQCISYPKFAARFGFDLSRSALSTAELRMPGLVLVGSDMSGTQRKTFQEPSWKIAGSLGGMIFDEIGNVYTFPTPHVNLIQNPPEKSNIIYKVDAATGVMTPWKDLPPSHPVVAENVFGVMGLSYFCQFKSIYATSVMGSSKDRESGRVYQLDLSSGQILNVLENFDGFGVTGALVNSKPVLLLGRARDSNVYVLELNEKGGFISRPKVFLSIHDLGPRGDDRAKKILIDEKSNSINVVGFEFQFNLASTLQREESTYKFSVGKGLK
jgi:hypothetical protein